MCIEYVEQYVVYVLCTRRSFFSVFFLFLKYWQRWVVRTVFPSHVFVRLYDSFHRCFVIVVVVIRRVRLVLFARARALSHILCSGLFDTYRKMYPMMMGIGVWKCIDRNVDKYIFLYVQFLAKQAMLLYSCQWNLYFCAYKQLCQEKDTCDVRCLFPFQTTTMRMCCKLSKQTTNKRKIWINSIHFISNI